jgi:glucose-6-phosphate 1-dehydrogenase
MQPRQNATLIIFGATGDLMKKKIAPALYTLFTQTPDQFPKRIIATGRSDYTNETYRTYVADALCEFFKLCDPMPEQFNTAFEYIRGSIESDELYETFAQTVDPTDELLVYCSVGCDKFLSIANGFKHAGLIARQPHVSAIFEKPHGYNLRTYETLVEPAIEIFGAERSHLIEHYFAKDIFSYVIPFRFAEGKFESLWNTQHIEHIDIRLFEEGGVETRGLFYDSVGALRDMGQNHIMQLLAVLCMDRPAQTPTGVHESRARFLESLPVLTENDVQAHVRRFQYNGYTKIKDVMPGSAKETAFMLETTLQGERWHGVRVTLGSGKRISTANDKRVTVYFRSGTPDPRDSTAHLVSLCISVQPFEGIIITTEKNGHVSEERLEPTKHAQALQYVGEYTKILRGGLTHDQALFVSPEEVRAMWRFIDPITYGFEHDAVPLELYVPNSDTVKDAYDLLLKNK